MNIKCTSVTSRSPSFKKDLTPLSYTHMNGVRLRIVLSFRVSTLRQNRRGGTRSANIRQGAWRVRNWIHTRTQPQENSSQNLTHIKDLTAIAKSTALPSPAPQTNTFHDNLQNWTNKTHSVLHYITFVKESKGTVHPRTGHERPDGGVDVLLSSFFNLGARWGG